MVGGWEEWFWGRVMEWGGSEEGEDLDGARSLGRGVLLC